MASLRPWAQLFAMYRPILPTVCDSNDIQLIIMARTDLITIFAALVLSKADWWQTTGFLPESNISVNIIFMAVLASQWNAYVITDQSKKKNPQLRKCIFSLSEEMFPESTQATRWMFPSAEVNQAPSQNHLHPYFYLALRKFYSFILVISGNQSAARTHSSGLHWQVCYWTVDSLYGACDEIQFLNIPLQHMIYLVNDCRIWTC